VRRGATQDWRDQKTARDCEIASRTGACRPAPEYRSCFRANSFMQWDRNLIDGCREIRPSKRDEGIAPKFEVTPNQSHFQYGGVITIPKQAVTYSCRNSISRTGSRYPKMRVTIAAEILQGGQHSR
jgi:hypothetical protein